MSIHRIVWLLATTVVAPPITADAGTATAVTADAFLNSLGVNSAVSRRGENLEQTANAARYLGLRWIRSGYESRVPVSDLIELHRQTGVRFSYGLLSGGTDIARLLDGARQLASAGALLAVEGNNEPNNWGITYEGERGGRNDSWLPVAKLQRDLYRAVKNDSVLKNYPVWSLTENGAQVDNVGLQFLTIPSGAGTLMPDGTQYADAANCHNYVTHPGWPGLHDNQTWVAADPTSDCRVDGLFGNYSSTWRRHYSGHPESELLTLPRVTTETGVKIEGPVTEEIQALLFLSLYLDQFKRGWSHTAVYLLRDRTDEGGNQTFGFFRPDYTPRLAATYLHNLTTILADQDSSVAPGELEYSIGGQPTTVHDLLLQKSDGRFAWVVWNERFTGGSDTVTVDLGATFDSLRLFDPTIGTSPIQSLSQASSVELTLSNHPVIIEISGPSITAVAETEHLAPLLRAETFKPYIDGFNRTDQELYPQHIPNTEAWTFLRDNIPLLECPDPDVERTYYFRWWTYRKHLKQTPDGFVITEFLPPVGWAGKYNTISCAAGHHFYEGRWLHDPLYSDDYATFWFRGGGAVRSYSFWAADALWARYQVQGDPSLPLNLLPDLIDNYQQWEESRLEPDGLFWQIDDRDGMELSVGGSGKRATINSYMYGDAVAIANLAALAGRKDLEEEFREKAARLKSLVQSKLWDAEAQFFRTLPRGSNTLVKVRELHGYTPWYFNLPDQGYAIAWKQLFDPSGFSAPYGPTTTEQRHAGFRLSYEGHECQWNGPSWPFSTSVTLTALANLLNNSAQDVVSQADYFNLLMSYAKSHQLTREDGQVVPWIDENLHPNTGDWIARTRLKTWSEGTWDPAKGGVERGKDYNHSTYCDLVISGLIGLRPRADDIVEVNPLVPPNTWDWFCLDNVLYHGRNLTIFWDKTGARYGRGRGLHVLADGQEIAHAESLGRLEGKLPSPSPGTAAGWQKSPANPVLGGALGTCFDVTLLKEADTYRMWFSWRPKKSVALSESQDGIHWTEPSIVLGPNPDTDWEDDMNRPSVVKREDGCHMWYTGQARGHSWIGYATSPDGLTWERRSPEPVLSSEERWEKVAVMCPHVIWDAERQIFRMWYSAGEQYEPNAIGYATSTDGLRWTKHRENPLFAADPSNTWERHKVTACQVIPLGDWHLMFYIGFRDEDFAQIGLAKSRDGVTGWERHPANPIIFPVEDMWDGDACYKPFAILDEDQDRWLLWYNGRKGSIEQIGMAIHAGVDLGFPGP